MGKEKAPQVRADEGAEATDNDTTERYSRQVSESEEAENRVVDEGEEIGDWNESLAEADLPSDLEKSLIELKRARDENDVKALEEKFKSWGRRAVWTGILYDEMKERVENALGVTWIEAAEELHVPILLSPYHGEDVVRRRDETGAIVLRKKKGHWHVLFYVPGGKLSYAQVKSILGERLGVVMIEPVLSQGALVRYFCHLDCEPFEVSGKKKYPTSELVEISGYEAMPYLMYRETDQISGIRAIQAFAKEHDIYQYSTLVDRLNEADRPDWNHLMMMPATRTAIRDYMWNRYHASGEAVERELVQRQESLESMFEQMCIKAGIDFAEIKEGV